MVENVIITGIDGFCGWPCALHLSENGYNVIGIDNLSRRKIDVELGCDSLTPILPIKDRIETWNNITQNKIKFYNIDISDNFHRLLTLIKKHKPKAIIHFAEQRSAPYSMKSPYHKRYTLNNNLNATNNVLNAIVESGLDIHLIHLGTTGYYGYSSVGLKIPEGYLPIKVDVDGEEKQLDIMYPPNPGSIYHLTKCQDALLFHYYNKNDKLRITDLHQGVVWGTETNETKKNPRLINRFDYDGDYGTVLNRFLMQSQVGHPLTIYGIGGQTRAFIHIQDTVQCVRLAIENPPETGDRVKIFNQVAECLNIFDLARTVQKMTKCKILFYKNPRQEDEKNDLDFENIGFKNLGWEPITLEKGLMKEVTQIAKQFRDRCDKSKIICTSTWTKDLEVDRKGSKAPVRK